MIPFVSYTSTTFKLTLTLITDQCQCSLSKYVGNHDLINDRLTNILFDIPFEGLKKLHVLMKGRGYLPSYVTQL